ncbi:hypothetical protein A2U01_0079276, partial [Trifolium medium]|nr:hypothetical protein [Trifolium medium]
MKMDVSLTCRMRSHLAAVSYNNGRPNLFQINVDETFDGLKHQLDQLNRTVNNPS